MKTLTCLFALASALIWVGCSDNKSTSSTSSTGGSASSSQGGGGTTGVSGTTGGTTSPGGSSATGGIATTGGTSRSGGMSATGGAAGGSSASAGSSASGGRSATGGSSASGGNSGTGGRVVTGGSSDTGGKGTAGASSGGTVGGATGGRTGGATGTGGTRTGGTTGTGGTSAGGTTSASTIIAATPPMGWNSWNKFACDGLNETVVKKMADAFITSGMKDAGYQYVNLDDCWMDGRDSAGKYKVNASKFPAGIKSLADYVHGKGLKLGIYSTPNTKTCAGIYGGYAGGVGSLGRETTDAQTWAEWGIDYLKYDKCQGALSAFAVMRDALKATGRPIVYSINPGDQGPYCTPTNCSIDLPKIANLWRIEFDISANWASVIRLIDKNKPEYVGAGPGHWNDPDMLEVGNGLNDTEGRAHFSMWAIMASPLITGNDLSTPGTNLEVWSKKMTETNTRAVALFNRGTASASITVKWSDIGLAAGAATVRDLWAAKDLGPSTDSYTATNVASHTVVMLKIASQ
jgi:alpha-galactosidase